MMFAGGAILLAMIVPGLLPDGSGRSEQSPRNNTRAMADQDGIGGSTRRSNNRDGRKSDNRTGSRVKSTNAPRSSAGGGSVMISRDASGHFQTVARMNGRRVPVLVDTGATNVAINVSLARRLGISLGGEDFIHQAQTANGLVKIAKATIRDVRIGAIVLDEVEAVVLPDNALSNTLLGSSFLNRLTKYQVQNGELRMTQ